MQASSPVWGSLTACKLVRSAGKPPGTSMARPPAHSSTRTTSNQSYQSLLVRLAQQAFVRARIRDARGVLSRNGRDVHSDPWNPSERPFFHLSPVPPPHTARFGKADEDPCSLFECVIACSSAELRTWRRQMRAVEKDERPSSSQFGVGSVIKRRTSRV